ncbi:ABC transporter ATP-binding protein [Actinomadura viridis]|uniref:Spermidine/putrescine import ATP-binding protein PotA n=1 Tax=Actinomadura viridis TaxID=58110 RepID=A0A931DFE4_9ACTN|nr:ABC transporter ATP-binding protein [Actinomadura viridis]MBG6087789.1 spermidine/putrescine transport system ATP-binding protein [Actinomadura viridis]
MAPPRTTRPARGPAPAGAGAPPDGALPAIELAGVVKEFHVHGETVAAVRGLDLAIAQGEFFSLLGPSGCGKTTTLRMIAGFEEPTAGEVRLRGRAVNGVPAERRDVNTVFQSYALFPHMNVFENVAFGLRRRRVPKAEIRDRVGEMLETVDLAGRERHRPARLSGGQQQRVALARALVNRPRALLLDEPLGALDLRLRQAMQGELKRIQRETGVTFVYVTHDQAEALAMSDRIAVMNGGRVEQLGTPREIYERPATRFVAGFIGTSNVIEGRVAEVPGGRAVIAHGPDDRVVAPLDPGRPAAPGDRLELTVRPEKITIGPDRPDGTRCAVRGTVAEVTYLGTSTSYTVTTAAGAEVVVFTQNAASADGVAARGDTVWLSWDPRHSYVLGAST